MVAGYVVMRVPMVFLWLRRSRGRPAARPAAAYIWTISVAQVFWVVLAIVDLPIETTFAIAARAHRSRFAGPFIAERRRAARPGTRITSPSATASW